MSPRQHESTDLHDQPPRIRWSVVLSLFALGAFLRFAYFYLDDLTSQVHSTFLQRAIEEGTGGIASALLFPIALLLERHFPVDNGRWRRNWAVHIGGYVVYSIAHTSALALMRALLFPAFGERPYDYGVMSIRYPMEAAQDFFSYAAFLGVLTLMRVQQRLRAREVHAAELQRDAANARLESLSLRLQPHFLFNALNTISSTAYEDPVAADEMIGRLGELLRRALRTGDRHEVSVAEELETLGAYLAFVEARFGDRLRCRIDVDPSVTELSIPTFLLQPLVENAVRHGASLEVAGSEIVVTIARRDDDLEVLVENGVDPLASGPARIGTGLGATRDRLRLLHGDRAALTAVAHDGRFRVTARFPARLATQSSDPTNEPATAHASADR